MIEREKERERGERERETNAKCHIYLPTQMWAGGQADRHLAVHTTQQQNKERGGEGLRDREDKQRVGEETDEQTSASILLTQGQWVGITGYFRYYSRELGISFLGHCVNSRGVCFSRLKEMISQCPSRGKGS